MPQTGQNVAEVYGLTFQALVIVAVLGVVLWEPVYHGLQQLRWEKDWPTGVGLVVGVIEGVATYIVLSANRDVPGLAFVLHFATTWFLVWCTVNGPLRIILLRWRYRGGRIL